MCLLECLMYDLLPVGPLNFRTTLAMVSGRNFLSERVGCSCAGSAGDLTIGS